MVLPHVLEGSKMSTSEEKSDCSAENLFMCPCSGQAMTDI